MSSFRLGTMRNALASAKRSLTPDLIKSIAGNVPDIAAANFVRLMENGATAGLVYVKDSDERDASDQPRVTFIFIKFVNEHGVWKVDGEMNIGSPKFQKNGEASACNPADLPPTHEIDGKVRNSPEQALAPDISAVLDVSSTGYKTELTINEVEESAILNKSYLGLIKKGLRKGRNSIVIRFTKTDVTTSFKPGVTVRMVTGNRKFKEVFKYEPKDAIDGIHTFSFMAGQ